MSSSICPTCQTAQRKFYCVDCLSGRLHKYRDLTARAEEERDAQIDKAKGLLETIDRPRVLRARLASLEDSIIDVRQWTEKAREQNEILRSRLIRNRENLRRRRVNLEAAFDYHEVDKDARRENSEPPSYTDLVRSQKGALQLAHDNLAHNRRVLIRELVQVFDIRESIPPRPPNRSSGLLSPVNAAFGVGSVFETLSRRTGLMAATSAYPPSYLPVSHAPSSNSNPSSQSPSPVSYAITSLAFPANPAELANLPLEHVQAVIASFLHFIRLLTFYLNVKLPFQIVWDSGLAYGVGRPWIYAVQGDEDGGWAKYPAPQPLFPPPLPPSSQAPDSEPFEPYPIPLTVSAIVGDQPQELMTSNTRLLPSFTTALAMLQYNVAYLLFSQRIPRPYTLPLSSASPPDALRSLLSLCFSPSEDVGLFSHSAMKNPYRLSAPTNPHRGPKGQSREPFDLDFGELLRVMHAAAGTKDGKSYLSRRKRGHVGDDDWDIVEVEEEEEENSKPKARTSTSSRNRTVSSRSSRPQ
ncbi:hypothetical protein DL93DRAFT_53718 [Clavulina sp. PMI_390]|nr:hypothetical protein DL93DRAFT_53718 [Clavulina sp. PMI_390]